MNRTAVFFGEESQASPALSALQDRCRREQFQVNQHRMPAESEAVLAALPSAPCVVFMPALKEDLMGVKIFQAIRDSKPGPVVCLYSDILPQPEYMALAFREGVDDIIALDADPQRLDVQVSRALRLVNNRMQTQPQAKATPSEESTPPCRCEKWKERLLALAATAGRIATGELWLSREKPELLIVSSSVGQGKAVRELAERLGFACRTASTCDQALAEAAKQNPRVVLADGTLPDGNVRQFAGKLRKSLGDSPVVVIAWSSSPSLEREVLVPGSGVDDFVAKGTTGESRQLLIGALLGALR
jgi:DNA-binding response OmpR family regulator